MDIGIEAEVDLDELMGHILRSVHPNAVIDSMLDHLLDGAEDRDEALCRNLIRRINTRLKEEHPFEEEEDDEE